MGSPSSTTTTSDDEDDDKSHQDAAARAMHQEEFNNAEGRLDSTRKRLFVEGDDDDDDEKNTKNNNLLHRYMGHDNRSRSQQSEQSYQSSSSSFGGSYYSTDEEEDNALSQLLLEGQQYQHHRTSPTSVNIVMGLEGAVEVALKDVTNGPDCSNNSSSSSLNSKHQRHQQRNPIRTSSLLDIEKTPQRNHTSSSSSSSVASFDTPTGTGCGGGGGSSSGKMSVERTITCYLEDPTTNSHGGQDDSTCTDWQFFFFGGGGMCGGFGGTAASSDPTNPSPSRETVRSMLQRRTSHNLRARKVRQLRKDIAPFGNGSPARSPAKAPSLFRNQSFSISDHRSAIARVSNDHTPRRSSFANVLQLCTMPEHTTLETPEIKRKGGSLFLSDNSEDLGYDSDPEDFTRRRYLSKKTAFSGEGSSSQSEGTHNRGFCTTNNIVSPSSNASPFQPFLDPENDEMSATIVQEFFNQSSTLVFHPHSSVMMDSSDVTLSRPIAVEAWLERGQHLADSLLQPKWMWKQKGAGKNLQMQMADLHGVELLDVTRILKLEDITADEESCSLLPFAKPSHCFVIKSIHDEELYFEARSQAERDRLVYSLKIVIARFGAKVLVGDPAVYYEFFSMSDGVPGE
eukprot:CAMPEP_0113440146 /NCGR_PEP_ID=MMETSP0014_2-20120614/407_1 /TAXON_ID=2857 /ORGANISM="Nitzschia sp." /LENGTH=624 /DNA_ID=CAMNT_0000330931 /DNA_START=363 /DNA_END=2234 /DNA_ORIENTATION=- /assembly_acc=CAM_ASM_000159